MGKLYSRTVYGPSSWWYTHLPTPPAQLLSPHEPPSQTEYNEIRWMLEPLWHVFNLVLEYDMRPHVYTVVRSPSTLDEPLIITEIPLRSASGYLIQTFGAFAHPPGTCQAQRMMSNKFNLCDLSIQLFFCYLEPALEGFGATVNWLAVEAKSHTVYHLEGRAPDVHVRHSVFSITTRFGEEYIADFTIEQLGFPSGWWLMRRRDYEDMCTTRRRRQQPSGEEVERARRGECMDWSRKRHVVREVCGSINLREWRFMDETSKMIWLEHLVSRASWWQWGWHAGYRWYWYRYRYCY